MPPAKKKSTVKKSIKKIATKPRSSRSARYFVKSIQTLSPEIIVTYCCRSSDESIGAYVKPMIDAYTADIDNDGPTPELFNVHYVTSRRAGAMNVVKKVSSDSPYDWELLVSINDDPLVKASDIGENIARRFSDFKTENYESQSFKMEEPSAGEANLPVNAFVLDWDAVVLLRKIYSESSKQSLMADDDVMTMFFGSVENGHAILLDISDFKWNTIF
eukprot:scaffold8514_cov74-Skeletonema_dohrnii-CCMP3373.AAC.5